MTIIDLLRVSSRSSQHAYVKVLIAVALGAFALAFAALLIYAGSAYMAPDG
jgi:hypothetical protein